MGLINFWGQKSKLDELQNDLAIMKLYVTHVSGCIAEIDACWIGNKDKQKVVNAISSHLHLVNKSNSNLNTFKQTATFVLIKMNELGSLVGLTPPFVSQICLPGICSNFRLNPKIQINTTTLRLVADKIEGERKHLDNTSFAINSTKNIIDNIILNLFGLNNLLRAIERDVAEQKLENQKIASGIRRICDLYESTENRLKEKIEAMAGLGTTFVVDPLITPPPTPPSKKGDSSGNSFKNTLPVWSLKTYDDPSWYQDSNGNSGSVAIWNNFVGGQLSCTFYTLRKLRERGLGFPFIKMGNAMGNQWYDNCTDDVPKYPGNNSIRDIIASGKLPAKNIVVSFSATHVLLIDSIDENGNVTYSDMYPDITTQNGSNPAKTVTIDQFMSNHDGIVGAVVIGE